MTVACVFVKGPYPYTPDYVTRLEKMVRKHLNRPFRFVCLTDQPKAFTAPIETIAIDGRLPYGYWNKIELWNPKHGLSGRVLFLDLDVLVISDLAPLVDYPAPFALITCEMAAEKGPRGVDDKGRTIIRQFNASAMVWYAGVHRDLYEKWTPAVAERLQGDQDWYAERYPNAAGMPVEWFPRLSRLKGLPPETAKVVLSKKPKNHLAVKQYPWFEAMWGGWN